MIRGIWLTIFAGLYILASAAITLLAFLEFGGPGLFIWVLFSVVATMYLVWLEEKGKI